MDRVFLCLGSVFGMLGVLAGAFGAHGLRARVGPEMLAIFETAARYQLIHALALVGVAWVCSRLGGPLPPLAGWLFTAGIVIFSGSLYLLVFNGARGWGAVTPVGGLALIAGWAVLALAALKAPVHV